MKYDWDQYEGKYVKVVFTLARKHYMLSLSPAMAIWKDGRISIEITSLGKIARSKSRVWMNPIVMLKMNLKCHILHFLV